MHRPPPLPLPHAPPLHRLLQAGHRCAAARWKSCCTGARWQVGKGLCTALLALLADCPRSGRSGGRKLAALAAPELTRPPHPCPRADDARGVGEPLNETMCGCTACNCPGELRSRGGGPLAWNPCRLLLHVSWVPAWNPLPAGLVARGLHWLLLAPADQAAKPRRTLQQQLNDPPLLAFSAVPREIGRWAAQHGSALHPVSFPSPTWLLRLSTCAPVQAASSALE